MPAAVRAVVIVIVVKVVVFITVDKFEAIAAVLDIDAEGRVARRELRAGVQYILAAARLARELQFVDGAVSLDGQFDLGFAVFLFEVDGSALDDFAVFDQRDQVGALKLLFAVFRFAF